MKFVCDAPGGKTWFRIESESEAVAESELMHHAVEKYFRQEKSRAAASYVPATGVRFEQEIGLKAHLERTMPVFLTLRDDEGKGLATAMLPPRLEADPSYRTIVVGTQNIDPYPAHGAAIRALAEHVRFPLERERCFPYRRSG
jgi:hypothetical protein